MTSGKKSSIFNSIQKSKTFIIVSHYHPDGDALGSTLALGLGLKGLAKEVVMYNRDPVPFNLKFLPHSKDLVQNFPKSFFDCAIMVDCAQPKRISKEFEEAYDAGYFKSLVCIDHHLLDAPVGDIDWIEPDVASTGCVIWRILKRLKVRCSKDIANLIYCTLTVDTGSFRYSNTTAQVFRFASELLEAGADPWFVAQNLEENNPPERFSLMRLCLESLMVRLGGKYATMDVTLKSLQAANAGSDLTEEFANFPRSIRGVEVSALFREEADGRVKVSLRSKSFVDVAKIAKSFGGGGHEHAAGCNFICDFVEAKVQIEEAVRRGLSEDEGKTR